MGLIQIDTHPPRKQLNVFGVCWLVFFGAVGAVVLWKTRHWPAAGAVWAAAAVVPAVGWALPGFMRIVYVALAFAAYPIGLVVSFTVLLAVFYFVFTPIGLLMRLFGHDPMARRFEPEGETYWLPHRPADTIKRYFRQF